MAKKNKPEIPVVEGYDSPEKNLKLPEQPQPVMVAFKAGNTVEKYGLSEEEVEDVVASYLGCHPKYVLWGGYDCKVQIYELAKDGYNFSGFLPCLKKIGAL